ncbi:hypothetical protein INR49_010444, partial [Caranx melampygus]
EDDGGGRGGGGGGGEIVSKDKGAAAVSRCDGRWEEEKPGHVLLHRASSSLPEDITSGLKG